MLDTISAALPVLLLVALGGQLKANRLFAAAAVNDLKKFVINVTLPLLRFNAFAPMRFEARFLTLETAIFLVCMLVLALARRIPSGALYFSS